MSDKFRIFGAELSPYSVKVRSYFRYKGISHEWNVRDTNTMAEYKRYARLPIIPAVATPEGEGLQDSTPIIESLEARVPEPSIHPDGGTLRFLSELIEEFADEWGNKWMFHYRWAREADQPGTHRQKLQDLATLRHANLPCGIDIVPITPRGYAAESTPPAARRSPGRNARHPQRCRRSRQECAPRTGVPTPG